MHESELLRKPLTKILLVNWSRFGAVEMKINKSTLFTGINGSGKSTVLDALTYIIAGNNKFNTAAKDKDRTVLSYVRGDTKSKGKAQYLRSGNVISYVAMEFYSPNDKFYITVGVCIESADDMNWNPNWFLIKDAEISDINFYHKEGNRLVVTPKNELKAKGVRLKPSDFMKKEKGVVQIQHALGIRCEKSEEYRRKLLKMMCFQLENNIDKFIRDSVLPEVEITTLSELRELKIQFEKIHETYDGILKRQKLLEEIERLTQNYESKASFYDLKRAELYWQEYVISQRKCIDNKRRIDETREKLLCLGSDYNRALDEYEKAQNRYNEADYIFRSSDFYAVADSLEKQISEIQKKIEKANDEKTKISELKAAINKVITYLDIDQKISEIIASIDSVEGASDEKRSTIRFIKNKLREKTDELKKIQWRIENEIEQINDSLTELENQINSRKNEQRSFPRYVISARDSINEELGKMGVDARVRVFAELVEDIIDPEWRDTIELYLGRKKYDFIIDGNYTDKALAVFHRMKLKKPNLVLTDKLDVFETDENSAAKLLKIPNIYARRYADYLLGRIYLCNDIRELHDHPLGGLMKDGTLAKSYTVRNLDIDNVQYHLGQEAVRLQLKKDCAKREQLRKLYDELNQNSEIIKNNIVLLENVEIDTSVEFEILSELPQLEKRLSEYRARLNDQMNNPAFTTLKEQLDLAKKERDDADKKKTKLFSDKEECKKKMENLEEKTDELIKSEKHSKESFEQFILLHLDLRKKAVEEYERQSKNSPTGEAISQRTVDDNKREMDKAIKEMEDEQLKYCVLANLSTDNRGVSYIGKYRKERNQVVNIDAENVKQSLGEHKEKLESAFVTQFVSAICEALDNADREIAAINKELSTLPFGQDIYSFTKKPRKDKETFFRIKRKLYDNQLNVENAYAQNYDDAELRQDIKELMDEILQDAGDEEYADYRTYYVYDMNIENTFEKIEADLSEKQGSASNGEKQTPYFIILAASLMQCYPKDRSCARLAFIDEAFAALSQERIEQMVKYFEQNGFQVMYAAPPEKINSIGNYIDTTISLIETGRYTNAVEGLINEYIDS